MAGTRSLQLNRLRVLRRGEIVYDQAFHAGVNIIRGQNGSGKSTIADFIFFILGGEFDNWKDAARGCDEVQGEIGTPNGKLTLRRNIDSKTSPVSVFFGSMEEASKHALEGWESFPIRRQGSQESFSQVLFRSLNMPEAQSEGASNITVHQLLRLCYSDQRTPAPRLFRFESFDTHNIREAVGDLICGVGDYEIYENGLRLRDLQKQLDEISTRLSGLFKALPPDDALRTTQSILSKVRDLTVEREQIHKEIASVDDLVNPLDVSGYLRERRIAQIAIGREREGLQTLEHGVEKLELELRQVAGYQDFLNELIQKLTYTEIARDAVGSIEFTHCPACGSTLDKGHENGHCIVCKNPVDLEKERSFYNRIRLDLEIQTRESKQLIIQKNGELKNTKQKLRSRRRQHAAHCHFLK